MYSKENDSEADWFEFPYCRNKCNKFKHLLDCEAMPQIVDAGHLYHPHAKLREDHGRGG